MFPGFNRAKRSTISNRDWDRDGVKNRKDCEPMNWRKQGPEHERRMTKAEVRKMYRDEALSWDPPAKGEELKQHMVLADMSWAENEGNY